MAQVVSSEVDAGTSGVERPRAVSPVTVLDRPLVEFGREVCGDLAAALRREWLVTNGLGGYASSTLAGVNTRRYHGLLVAALTPPVGRTVLVGGMVEWATYGGQRYPLSAHEYGGGVIDPHGYRHLQSFALEGTLPVWTFALGDALLERRIWMAHGSNTTFVTYRLRRATRCVRLDLTPLTTYRDFHALSAGSGWQPSIEVEAGGVRIQAFEGATPFWLLADGGCFTPSGEWWWNFHHREEAARGLDAHGDLFAPGAFAISLAPGASCTLVLTTERPTELNGARALAAAQARQLHLLQRAGVEEAHPAVQQLTLAADQFVVARGDSTSPPVLRCAQSALSGAETRSSAWLDRSVPRLEVVKAATPSGGKTVIAGYHWFNDWGRDTMIALPGLTLATGRPEDAADILRAFAPYVADGLLPNNFPDSSGQAPGYNTVDAALWYVLAVRAYREATGDETLVDDLLPALRDIVDWHRRGTRFGIGVDPTDGLLRAGEPGQQLTWMDARIGDWVVTPRIGKPVEINALWYNALRTLAAWLAARGDPAAAEYETLADRARLAFRVRFVRADGLGLADVIDGPAGDDFSVRPNQIFAVSLPHPLLDGCEAASVVDVVGRALLTSYGLRSLDPRDPAYRGDYGGDQLRRDSAYHQGPVWTWLMGAYAEAHYRVYGNAAEALALLAPFEHHLRDAGLGSISEILEGDAPHLPRGCVAQAWGVAEALRVFRVLCGSPRARGRPSP